MVKKSALLATVVAVVLASGAAAYAADEDAGATPVSAPSQGVIMHKEWKGHEGEWQLSPEKRKMIHEAMESLHQKNEALWEKKFDLREELHAMMKSPQFDAQAYLAKKAQLDAIEDTNRKNREETFAQLAAKLSPQERMGLMRMEHHGHGGGHGWHRFPS